MPLDTIIDSYELMYGNGGHGGPYLGIAAAILGAKKFLKGCKSENRIFVVPRDTRPLDQRNAVQVVSREDL